MPETMTAGLATAYAVVSLEQGGKIVRYRRLSTPFASMAAVQNTYDQVLATFDRIGRAGRALLIDSREATGRNDAAFEAMLNEFRRGSIVGFVGHAVLMRTVVGSLHAQRIERKRGNASPVFLQEEEAVAYLLKLVETTLK
jgi:hypothetical protein